VKSTVKIFVLGIASISLASCALSHSTKQINYQPNFFIAEKLSTSKIVDVEPMQDARNYNNNKIIFYKKNMYNQTMSGSYIAEKPVVDILTEAVKDGFKQKNITLNSVTKDYILKSELIKLDYEVISGFSTVRVIPLITVKFQLINTEGKVIWTDILTGKANIKGAKFEKFIPPAIDNLVDQLVNNSGFLYSISEN